MGDMREEQPAADQPLSADTQAEVEKEFPQIIWHDRAKFKRSDWDDDGKLDLKEFIYSKYSGFPELAPMLVDVDQETKTNFAALDTNSDGSLSEEEIAGGHDLIMRLAFQ